MERKEENYYDVPNDFEPSISTKKYWRKTRKVSRTYGKQTIFPGLFNTVDYRTDITMFWFIVSLELLGLYLLGSAVRWNNIIFYGFLIAMFLDFVCVFWAHAFSGTILENKNWRIIAKYEGDMREDSQLMRKNITLRLITTIPAELVLFCIALGKIYFYVDAKGGIDQIIEPGTGKYDLKIIGVCVIYLLIFVLHTVYSGYAIHGYRFKRRIRKEYETFKTEERSHIVNNLPFSKSFSDNQVNAYREYVIDSNLLLLHNIKQIRTVPPIAKSHYIDFNDQTNSYKLYTWGLLRDDDLHAISQMHQNTDSEKLFVGVQGLKHQLYSMVSAPKFI